MNNYFVPLELVIASEEKQAFLQSQFNKLKSKYSGSNNGLANVGNVTELFPNTIAQTDEFVKPLGLKTRAVTLFAGDADIASYSIHADGVYYNRKPALLEARLSYYELAEAPGTINWWDSFEMPMTMKEYPATEYSAARINVMADCVEDLVAGKLEFDDLPDPVYSTETSVPSAILRTNQPHNVVQGPGLRITISCQLVFQDGNPTGVWDHIQNNIKLLGV
jgi:hypothetical protein